ncbi:MAG: Ig-like domain-containing protein [Bacteroidota bacterium]|nr:Ig-like domain-containing protein [Bacteroidota bacterium]
MKKIYLITIAALGFIFILNSCSKITDIQTKPDHSIQLTFDTVRITQGTTQFLAAKNYHADQINWASSDTSIAKIDATGLINAFRPGVITITAVSKTYAVSAKCVVIVGGNNISDTKVSDVSVGADGSIYVIGTDLVSPTGGYGIYKVAGDKLNKLPLCAGVRIAVGPDGRPWVVNKSHIVYRFRDSTSAWEQLPGTATDIGIGADGSTFIIGTQDVSPSGGKNILKWDGSNWTTMPGCAGIHIAVDPTGIPYVANLSNIVYKYDGISLWNPIGGVSANDIGIGANGSVYVTGTTGSPITIAKLIDPGSWASISVSSTVATSISVKPNGDIVYIDGNGLLHLN